MKSIQISAKKRTELGGSSAARLRREENVPCVLYGGEEPIHFYAHKNAFRHLVYTPEVKVAEIDIEGQTYRAIMQDVQFDPVTDALLHIDFIQLVPGKPVTVEMPVNLTGNARGVRAGGKLKLVLRKVKVRALPENLPDSITYDITDLRVGQSVRVADLATNGYEILNAPSAVLCSIKTTRNVVKDVDEETETAEATA
ncbi:MAG: 50S ribosomal protein L25/general stress protein Ctc [Thermaurantimonas sp.]|uniref:50S ribosomal protein L25/general stress protein Ctc n=1 Tax=Thermaurantimonas sp. TaxID=2681568 RepID=UPI00391E0298